MSAIRKAGAVRHRRAAVAAATAHYVADLRTQGKERENLMFYTGQMLSSVARRHSQVEAQEEFDAWLRLALAR